MHAMLQHATPGSYVVAMGESHSVAEFVAAVLAELHGITDSAEAAHLIESHVELDSRLMRTGEIHDRRGDTSRVRRELGRAPTVDFRGLVRMMVAADLAAAGTTLPDPRPRR
jgi:GDPmannose 4,6-dehydratase